MGPNVKNIAVDGLGGEENVLKKGLPTRVAKKKTMDIGGRA